ncbi:MAG: N-formylglutamate amidohydrolase [Candidatus Moranbacteria bacterium]|nr:N-formylglutamate amidohydrolase [Candidatus Moranbacteria bacterium]
MKSFHATVRKNSPILFTCEHSSTRIPRRYGRLGLSKQELLGAKDLYDVGAFDLSRDLVRAFGASFLHSTMSRLVVDYNRPLDFMPKKTGNGFHASALKTHLLVDIDGEEHLIDIPGNHDKTEKEEGRRFARFARPYQHKGQEIVQKILSRHKTAFLFQIHSFFPHYNGEKRSIDIDVMFNHSRALGNRLVRFLRQNSDFVVAPNRPWGMKDCFGGAFSSVDATESRARVITFEVNNRLMDGGVLQEKVSRLLSKTIEEIVIKNLPEFSSR